ncbi:2912_t:CDS:2, partial [Diversispora eburnea]
MDETRNNYCLEVEPSKWSLPNFLEWRFDFYDFSSRKIENINWKKQLKKIIVNKNNLYDESMLNKAHAPEVKEFWRQHGSFERADFLRPRSVAETTLQSLQLKNYNLLLEIKDDVLKLKMDLLENTFNYVKLISCLLGILLGVITIILFIIKLKEKYIISALENENWATLNDKTWADLVALCVERGLNAERDKTSLIQNLLDW